MREIQTIHVVGLLLKQGFALLLLGVGFESLEFGELCTEGVQFGRPASL